MQMMASLNFVLLLSISLYGSALTSAVEIGLKNQQALQNDSEIGVICENCTRFELLAVLLSSGDLQKKVTDGMENVCDHPHGQGDSAKLCKKDVEKMFPLALNFITAIAKPAEVCKILGPCGSCDKQEKMLRYFVKEALQVAVTSENAQPTTQCSFCIFLIKTLEDLLPKERTEDAVIKLLEEICHILPSNYRDQCQTVIGTFSKTVLDAILRKDSPHANCALIHLCRRHEAPLVALNSAVEIDSLKNQHTLKKHPEIGVTCHNCTGFELLAVLLSNEDHHETILDEKQCDDLELSPNVSKICKEDMKKLLPLALNLIFALEESPNIHNQTDLSSHVSEADMKHLGLPTCIFCKYIINTVVGLLPVDRTETAVVDALNKVCTILPNFLQNKCTQFVQMHLKDLLDGLLNYAAPKAICIAIRMCWL